jgi:hypothetical protein
MLIYRTGNPRLWLASMAISLALFAVLYLTVIRPDNGAANQAIRTGAKQEQQAIDQASQLAKSTGGLPKADAARLSKAAKLAGCVAAAGTDVTRDQACQAQYAG